MLESDIEAAHVTQQSVECSLAGPSIIEGVGWGCHA